MLLLLCLSVPASGIPQEDLVAAQQKPVEHHFDVVTTDANIAVRTIRESITFNEPVRWRLEVTGKEAGLVTYETPAIMYSAVNSSLDDRWTIDLFLWSSHDYDNFTFNLTVPGLKELDIQPPTEHTIDGRLISLHIDELRDRRSIRLTGIVEAEQGETPAPSNYSDNSTTTQNGTLTNGIAPGGPVPAPPAPPLRGAPAMRELTSSTGTLQVTQRDGLTGLRVKELGPGERVNVAIDLDGSHPEAIHSYIWGPDGRPLPYRFDGDRSRMLIELRENNDGILNGEVATEIAVRIGNITAATRRDTAERVVGFVNDRNVTLETPGATLAEVQFVDVDTVPGSPRSSASFSHELLKFRVEDVTRVADVYLTVDDLPRNPQLWKFNPNTQEWYRFPFEQVDDRTLRITIEDGGFGDDDGIVNGIIEDDLGITSGWWNESWAWRLALDVSNTAGDLINYSIQVTLSNDSFNYSEANDNLSDVRFIYYNASTDAEEEITHWLASGESQNYSAGNVTAQFRVKIPLLKDNANTTIFLYYGNTNASSTSELTLGSSTAPGRNCNEIYRRVQNATSGNYYIDPDEDGSSLQYVYCDMGLNNTGWTLLYNYDHTANTDPANVEGTWPTNHSSFSHEDNISRHGYTASDILGLRFRCNTSNHARVVHYYNSHPTAIQGVLDASTTVTVAYVAYNDFKFADHTGNLPDAATQNTPESEPGDALFGPGFPMYLGGTYHWSVGEPNRGGQRWECDDYPNNDNYDTLHQIWLAGNTTYTIPDPLPSIVTLGTEYSARINATIDEPEQFANLTRYTPFTFNGTVYCQNADCGNVTVSAQYFSQVTPVQTLTETSEADFNTSDSSENISIGNDLKLDILNSNWWDDDWQYRQPFVIDGAPANLTNYSMLLRLNSSLVGASFNWTTDEQAIRFRLLNATNGTSAMTYYTRSWNSTAEEAEVSLKIPYLEVGGNVTVHVYYGNPSASSESELTLGSATAPAKDCNDIYRRVQNATSGNYYIDPDEDGGSLQYVYCDMGLNNTGWTLLYNYDHTANTDPPNVEGVWPTSHSSFSHEDDISRHGYTASDILGLRFRCNTSAHSRLVHYYTSDPQAIQGVLDDTTSVDWSDVANDDWKFSDHTGNLPDAASADTNENEPGDALFGPGFPMYRGGQYHWSVGEPNRGGQRWECDDYPNNDNYDTLHQIWLAGNTTAPQVNDSLNVTTESEEGLLFVSQGLYTSSVIDINTSEVTYANISWSETGTVNTSLVVYSRSSVGGDGRWWDSDWQYRRKVTLTNTDKDFTNYTALISLNTTALNASGKIQDDCADFRFAYFNASTQEHSTLSYYFDACNITGKNTTFYVNIPEFENNSNYTVDVYYGNSAVADSRDADTTFLFWDDFETFTGWTQNGSGSVVRSSTQAYQGTYSAFKDGNDDPNGAYKSLGATYGRDIVQEFWLYREDPYSGGGADRVGLLNKSGDSATGGGDGYGLVYNHGGTGLGIDVRDGYSGSAGSYDTTGGDLMNYWVFARFTVMANGTLQSQRFIDGVEQGSTTQTDTTTQNFTIAYIFGGQNYYVDSLRLRYFAPSIVTSIAGEEDYNTSIADPENFIWSAWYLETNGGAISAPDGRYFQYYTLLNTTDSSATPTLEDITIGYRLASPGWADMQSSSTLFTTSNGYSCGIMQADDTCTPSFTVNPRARGEYSLRLFGNSTDGRIDFFSYEERNVTVYIQPLLSTLTSSVDPLIRGENSTVTVTLYDDASQPFEGYNITIYDETGNGSRILIGTNTSDSSGLVTLTYLIPSDATLGLHTFNASYNGSLSDYILPVDLQETFLATSRPNIANITVSPQYVGFGLNITITANVTDAVGLDAVRINITDESSISTVSDMTNLSGDLYTYTFPGSWEVEEYTFTIIANNTDGIETISDSEDFGVRAEANISFTTVRDEYPNEEVVLLDINGWYYDSLSQRIPWTIENTAGEQEEYQVYVTRDFSTESGDGQIQTDCGDVRFTWLNDTSQEEEPVSFFTDVCNLTSDFTAKFWVKVPLLSNATNTTIYLYHGNQSMTSASSELDTFSYSTPRTVAYVVSQRIVSNNLDLISYEDGNNISIGSTYYSLNFSSQLNIGGMALGTQINASKPISAAGSGNVDDMVVPVSWAGTLFHYGGQRDGTDRYCLLSPWGDATVDIYNGSSIWQDDLSVDATGICVSTDIPDGSIVRIVSDLPILVSRDGTTNNRDSYPFYPATDDPLYGPALSEALYISAGSTGGTVTAVNSSGGSASLAISGSADDNLASYMNNGEDGTADAVRLSSSTPLGAIQQADSDGSEATILVPQKEMSTVFGAPHNAEYIVAVATEPTNCTLNTTAGEHSSNVSVGTGTVHKISFGAYVTGTNGQPATYINGPWKMKCDKPVWAYYEADDSDSDETTMMGYKQMRQYAYPEPAVTEGSAEWKPGLRNTGTTNFSGYLRMQVQEWTGVTWSNIIPTVVSPQYHIIEAGQVLDVMQIWNDAGGWNTTTRDPGWYRVRALFEDDTLSTLVDSNGNSLAGYYNFSIIEAVLTVTNLTHENQEEQSLNEYETGDTIDWINVTFRPENNKAYDANVTLSVINQTDEPATWGPQQETQSCGDLEINETCERRFDNSTSGYVIPSDATSGEYVFTWNVTMDSELSSEQTNGTINFTLHNLPATAAGTLDDTRIFKPNWTLYNFSFTNTWSENLTGVNVTINCPSTSGFACNHTGTGAQTVNVGDLGNGSTAAVSFNISVNASVSSDNYDLNASLEYTNPGGEYRNWSELGTATLEVRLRGLLEITDELHPTNVTRGSSYDFRASMNNTGDTEANNSWLNYTLPTAWTVTSGDATEFFASIPAFAIEWNNITVSIGTGAQLGSRTVRIDSAADDGRNDFITYPVVVYAPTTLIVSKNQTVVDQGANVLISAQLLYDNGTPVTNQNISFRDETNNTDIGSDLTNSTGWASVVYAVPSDAALGSHTINASYNGSATKYTRAQTNTTTITVNQPPAIASETVAPNPTGYGQEVNISAEVTDDDSITGVTVTITAPNGSNTSEPMQLLPPDTYYATYNDTWQLGTYNVTIAANDSDGSVVRSTLNFTVEADHFYVMNTQNATYEADTIVSLTTTTATNWWNGNWPYRAEMNLSNTAGNLSEYQIYVSRNLSAEYSAGRIQNDCTDVRFSWFNTTSNVEEQATFSRVYCNLTAEDNATFWVKVPFIANNTNTSIYLYYGNEDATDASNESGTFSYSRPRTVAYVTSSTITSTGLDVVSGANDNNISIGPTYYDLDEFGPASNASGLTVDTALNATKLFSAEGSGDVDDMIVPIGWASTEFIYGGMRDNGDRFCIISPWGNATIDILDGSTTDVNDATVGPNGSCFSNDISDGNAARITSDLPVLVFHDGPGQSRDGWPFYPATTERLYHPSASSTVTVAAGASGATGTCYDSAGSSAAASPSANDEVDCSITTGDDGTGAAWYVEADNPIGAIQQADSDGAESTPAVPLKEFSTTFFAPHTAEYVVAVALEETTCTIYTSGGFHSSNTSSGGGNGLHKISFGAYVTGTNGEPVDYVTGPWKINCTSPVWAYYEAGDVDGDETTMFGYPQMRQNVYPAPSLAHGSVQRGSKLFTRSQVNTSGYLLMKVQRNTTGSWVDVETVINDLANGTLRTFNATGLDLATIWPGWNTTSSATGTYRIYSELNGPDGELLNNTDGTTINGTATFTITPSDLQVLISAIRVYDVTATSAANRHIYTNDFLDSGLNTTFTLTRDNIYRFEVDIESTGTSTWLINESNITYSDLNESWNVSASDIWYSTQSTLSNKRSDTTKQGGSFNGTVTWNTTYGGSRSSGQNATFFFIVNVSSEESRQVTLLADSDSFSETDKSILQVIGFDTEPPELYLDTAGATPENVTRGDSVKIFARWDETISEANLTYTTTTNTTDVTVTNSSPQNARNWTNFTLNTLSTWYLGNHSATYTVTDLAGNSNTSAITVNFYVWGLAQLLSGSLNTSMIGVGESVQLRCRVTDDTKSDAAITGYLVNFYNSTDLIGSSNTNSTGWATYDYIDNTPGSEQFSCNISRNISTYHDIDANNEQTFTLFTTEPNPPTYSSVSGPATAFKGNTVSLNALWDDDFALDEANLATNASGAYTNVSNEPLTGQQDWANFSYVIPTSFTPGYLGWYQTANDTSGNQNQTSPIQSILVYGRSRITNEDVNPGSVQQNVTTTMTCRVVDANSSVALSSYAVDFSYKLQSGSTWTALGTNTTNSTGFARYSFNLSTEGTYDVRCNITDDPAQYYNDSTDNFGTDTLNVVSGTDTQPPQIIGGNYGLNDSLLYYGECFDIFGLWNESINYSYAEFDVATGDTRIRNITPPYTNNWTNVSICTNTTWSPGNRSVKLYARDQAGNLNDTLATLLFELKGRAQISYMSPTGNQDRGTLTIYCNVTDGSVGDPLNNYTVYFWDGDLGARIGNNRTNASGIARFTYNFSSRRVGELELSCEIEDDDAKSYEAQAPTLVTESVYLYGQLIPTITVPTNNSILTRGTSESLIVTLIDDNGSTPLDQNGNPATITASWRNESGNQVATGTSTSWSIPNTYTVGPDVLTVNTTATYYYWGNDTVNVTIFGLANASFIEPQTGSAYPENRLLNLTCLISDDGNGNPINTYPVEFRNGGSTLGTNLTNSSGIAVWSLNTSSLAEGDRTFSCRIQNNATLYYNRTVPWNDSVTVTIDKTAPVIDYAANSDANGTYGRNWSFINVTITESNPDTARLYWNGTPEAFASQSGGSYWSNKSGLADGNYSYYAWINDTAGQSAQTQSRWFVVDTTPPVVTITSPENTSYNTTSITLNYTASDPYRSACWYFNGTGNVSLPGCTNTTVTGLSAGSNTIIVYSNDTVGNIGSANVSFFIDLTPPSVTLTSPVNESTYNESNDIDLNFTVSDNFNVSSCWYRLDGGSPQAVPSCQNTTILGLTNANHSLTLFANDSAGNVNSTAVWFIVNLTDLVVTIIDPANNTNYSATWVSMNVTANRDVLGCNYSLDGGAFTAMSNSSGTDWYANLTSLTETTHNITARCGDAVNVSQSSYVYFRIDRTGPTTTFRPPTPGDGAGWGFSWVLVNITTSEPSDSATLQWENASGRFNYTMTKVNATSFYYNVTDLTSYTYNYSVFAEDALGNVLQSAIRDVVVSLAAPIITLSSPQNTSYTDSIIDLSVTASEPVARWYYELNGEAFNFTPNTTITVPLNSSQLTVRAVDFDGLAGNASVNFTSTFTRWDDDFAGYSGLEYAENVRAEGNASINFCWPLWQQAARPQSTNQTCWPSRRAFNVSSPDARSNYQIHFTRNLSSLISSGELQSDCSDVRFSYWNGSQEVALNHWIESCSEGPNSSIWIKVPSLGTTTELYLYHDNPHASDMSNGSAVFDFWDDFDTMSSFIWGSNAANWIVESGIARPNATLGSSELEALNYTFGTSYITELQMRGNGSSASSGYYRFGNGAGSKNLRFFMEALNTRVNLDNGSNNRYTVNSSAFQRYTLRANFSSDRHNLSLNASTTGLLNVTGSRAGGTTHPRFYAYIKNGLYIDWIGVRKYAGTEPTIGSLGTTQTPTVNATMTSITITRPAGYSWGNLTAEATLPGGTNLTFQIRDTSNATLCGPILYSEAESGYEPCGAAQSETELRLFANFTTDTTLVTPALYSWNITWVSGVTQADLLVSSISFSNESVIEGRSVNVSVNLSNNGTADATGFALLLNISRWNGSTWILNESLNESGISLSSLNTTLRNFSWSAKIGTYRFLAVVDWNDSITESNETNNNRTRNYTTSAWKIMYGDLRHSFILGDSTDDEFQYWNATAPEGNILFSDSDASYDPTVLRALNGSDDLAQADAVLGLVGFNDSVSRLYDANSDTVSDATATFVIGGIEIANVPVVNTTSTSAFITGILWDGGDPGAGYDGSQDLIFVTKVNISQAGAYGTYDYEARVPATLGRLTGVSTTVERLQEII